VTSSAAALFLLLVLGLDFLVDLLVAALDLSFELLLHLTDALVDQLCVRVCSLFTCLVALAFCLQVNLVLDRGLRGKQI
jgi:hypothetical protein